MSLIPYLGEKTSHQRTPSFESLSDRHRYFQNRVPPGSQCFRILVFRGGGRKRLPKFKFSAKFPIGLHVILQIQIKKIENDCYIM